MDLWGKNIAANRANRHDLPDNPEIVSHRLLRRTRMIILQIIGGLRHFTTGAEQVTQRIFEPFGRQMRRPRLP